MSQLVKYFDTRHGFYRFGVLVKVAKKYATVKPLMVGKNAFKVPLADVEPVEKEKH